MFLLRRTAFKAVIAQPTVSSIILPRARTFVTVNQSKLRPVRPWISSTMQRRFASSEVKDINESAVEKAAVAAAESAETPFLQTKSTESAGAVEGTAVDVAPEEQVLAEPNAAEAASIDPALTAAAAMGVAEDHSTSRRNSSPPQAQITDSMKTENTVYVGNIFFDVTELELNDFFSRFGPVKSAKIVRDNRGMSKGFGYVEFMDPDHVAKSLEANQRVFHGRRIMIQAHRPRTPLDHRKPRRHPASASEPSRTLFIGNMSFEMSDKDLSDLFREVRNVIDVRVAIDRRTGQPRGFAHADFFDIESATKAIEFLRGKELYGRRLRVDYSSTSRSAGQKEA